MRCEGLRVSIVIRQKFHLSSRITNLPSAITWRSGPIAFQLAATVDGDVDASFSQRLSSCACNRDFLF